MCAENSTVRRIAPVHPRIRHWSLGSRAPSVRGPPRRRTGYGTAPGSGRAAPAPPSAGRTTRPARPVSNRRRAPTDLPSRSRRRSPVRRGRNGAQGHSRLRRRTGTGRRGSRGPGEVTRSRSTARRGRSSGHRPIPRRCGRVPWPPGRRPARAGRSFRRREERRTPRSPRRSNRRARASARTMPGHPRRSSARPGAPHRWSGPTGPGRRRSGSSSGRSVPRTSG